MRKVFIDSLQEGMVVAADIFDPGMDGEFPLIGKGVRLSADYIASLRKHSIAEVLIETPPGYRGRAGEVLAPLAVTGDIRFNGAVEVNCDIPDGARIEACEGVLITGQVGAGCRISSSGGQVQINGSILGEKENRATIQAAGPVTVVDKGGLAVEFADLKSSDQVLVKGDVAASSFSARGSLKLNGRAAACRLTSQNMIRITECATGPGGEGCELVLKPAVCGPLFQKLLKVDKTLKELSREKEKLQNVIDLIRKLGRSVEQLSQSKRHQLALQGKRFHELEGEIVELQAEKEHLRDQVVAHLAEQRVVVWGAVQPGTKVTIGNSSLVVRQTINRAAFSVEKFKVVSKDFSWT